MTDPLVIAAAVLLAALVAAPVIILPRRRRNRQPASPVLTIDRVEANYAHAHGYTYADWQRLKPTERAALRASAAHGQNRNAA
jgi:hypothetical protein